MAIYVVNTIFKLKKVGLYTSFLSSKNFIKSYLYNKGVKGEI